MATAKPPQRPRLPKARTKWVNESATLQDFTEFTALTLDNIDFSTQQVDQPIWRSIQCRQTRFDATRFDAPRLIDAHLTGCILANAQWERPTWQRCAFEECQLIGFDAPDARLQDVTFTNCKAQYAKFRFGRFQRVRFAQCDLRNSDFQGTDLSGVIFHKCDLSDAQFSGTTLKGTDLRGSTLENLRVGIAELPGAIVEPVQAAYLAGVLGLVVRNEGDEP